MRLNYKQAVNNLALLQRLQEFTPQFIGTPPLGIALESCDIDIACSANDFDHFTQVATTEFGTVEGYQCRHSNWQNQGSVTVQFHAHGWDIQLFCKNVPTHQQWGVRHFNIEQRLLCLEPTLRETVVQLKLDGLKTEPALAHALGLPGDPYADLTDTIANTEEQNPLSPTQQKQTDSCC